MLSFRYNCVDKEKKILNMLFKTRQTDSFAILTNCMAMRRTVFKENCRLHKSNKSSKLGPNNSITRALYLEHGPK